MTDLRSDCPPCAACCYALVLHSYQFASNVRPQSNVCPSTALLFSCSRLLASKLACVRSLFHTTTYQIQTRRGEGCHTSLAVSVGWDA
eukprot:scaffold212300_cov41-Tisochrysis_lutea.AAC.1